MLLIRTTLLGLLLSITTFSSCKNINGEDGVLHNINWPGHTNSENRKKWGLPGTTYSEENSVIITSSNNERYQCMMPSTTKSDSEEEINAPTTSAAELLSPLLLKKQCTYRLEAYWTYELCHGKHIRQFHEEKAPGGKVKINEYYLGYFKEEPDKDNIFSSLNGDVIPQSREEVESKTVDGVRTPYFSIEMTDGTPCTLKQGNKRKTKVMYVCHEKSGNEIMSVTETSSCEYELTVLTPLLCRNPLYTIEKTPINEIYCLPLDDAPSKPKSLILDEKEEPERVDAKNVFFEIGKSIDNDNVDDKDDIKTSEPIKSNLRTSEAKLTQATDKLVMKDFLSGLFCLHGGSGWWRYEFCYGKHVKQYHDDVKQGRTQILVGTWDRNIHLNWVKDGNKARTFKDELDPVTKATSKKVKSVQLFYSNGEVCEETGKKREVVVKLKCMKNKASPHSVSLYLLEPSTCSYILGVESPIICDLLDNTDENGFFIDGE